MDWLNFKRAKFACYFTNATLASVFILPPILFATFHETYGVSYTLLGTLVLVNYCTQLGVDLVFTFFSHFFNLKKTLRLIPLLNSVGLLIYGLVPSLLPQYAYAGLLAGTCIFSVSAGLCEVLLSPTIAAMPSDNPERDMSLLHALYGYGSTAVALISTGFLLLFGTDNWMVLTLAMAVPPAISFILLSTSPLPEISISHNVRERTPKRRNTGLVLCAMCIFLGGAAELTMTNWISIFIENALHLPKMVGDTLGLAAFTLLLAFARTWYARRGKNILRTLLWGMGGAAVCYLVAAVSSNAVVSVLACMLTGLCTGMLWPGTLILMEEKVPNPGVAAYALLAACGDLGGSIAPQGMGIVVDAVAASTWAVKLQESLSLSPEQLGMKAGVLLAAVFPLMGIGVLLYIKKCHGKSIKSAHS